MQALPTASARFVALDVRHQFALAGAVDRGGQVALPPQRIAIAELREWLHRTLLATDTVILGVAADPWPLADLIAPLVAGMTIAHPQIANLLPSFQHGDNPREVLKLAQLHAAGLVPGVWVPPTAVRELRALAAQRRRLIQQHAAASATLEQILHQYALVPPGHQALASDRPDWWARAPLHTADKARARDNLAALNRATTLLRTLDAQILAIGATEPWCEHSERLLNIAGIARIEALVILSAIGAPERFGSAAQLAKYAGLAPGAEMPGSAAADGRHELRAAMLAVAERAVQGDATWAARFAALHERAGVQRAMVAIARKLLVQVWRMLNAAPAEHTLGDTSGADTELRSAA